MLASIWQTFLNMPTEIKIAIVVLFGLAILGIMKRVMKLAFIAAFLLIVTAVIYAMVR